MFVMFDYGNGLECILCVAETSCRMRLQQFGLLDQAEAGRLALAAAK